jgi:hypothetical protein
MAFKILPHYSDQKIRLSFRNFMIASIHDSFSTLLAASVYFSFHLNRTEWQQRFFCHKQARRGRRQKSKE